MNENTLNDLSIEELKKLKTTIEKFSNIEELSSQIRTEIKKKEETQKMTYNARLKLSTLTTFGLEERKILEENGIETMADLRKTDVSNLKGITEATKESIGWAKDFYNMDKQDPKMKNDSSRSGKTR